MLGDHPVRQSVSVVGAHIAMGARLVSSLSWCHAIMLPPSLASRDGHRVWDTDLLCKVQSIWLLRNNSILQVFTSCKLWLLSQCQCDGRVVLIPGHNPLLLLILWVCVVSVTPDQYHSSHPTLSSSVAQHGGERGIWSRDWSDHGAPGNVFRAEHGCGQSPVPIQARSVSSVSG